MKTIKLTLCFLLFLCFNFSFSQQKENKSEIAKTSDKVKQTSNETKDAVQTTKETLKDIGSIFKSKKDKTKQTVLIVVNNIEYGNTNLNVLQKSVKTSKSVKNITKKYQNNTATFLVEYKKSADELWQTLPEKVVNNFKIIAIEENSISIALKK
jgi:flagellum-specific peptidoglycan hydrolase FlgJ